MEKIAGQARNLFHLPNAPSPRCFCDSIILRYAFYKAVYIRHKVFTASEIMNYELPDGRGEK
jgi:hypothetical protein